MGSRCVAKHFRRIVPTLEQHLRRPFRKGQGTGEGHLVSGVPFQRGAAEHGLFPGEPVVLGLVGAHVAVLPEGAGSLQVCLAGQNLLPGCLQHLVELGYDFLIGTPSQGAQGAEEETNRQTLSHDHFPAFLSIPRLTPNSGAGGASGWSGSRGPR